MCRCVSSGTNIFVTVRNSRSLCRNGKLLRLGTGVAVDWGLGRFEVTLWVLYW